MTFKINRGNPSSRIMIIGENASRAELEKGYSFSGDSAVWLAKELEHAGHKFADAFSTLALDFYPPRGDATNLFHTKTAAKRNSEITYINGEYVDARVTRNAKRLWQLIDTHRPRFILALGNMPLWMLTGERSITAQRGSMLEITRPWGVIRLLPTYTPNAVMRKQELRVPFRRDLRRIDLTSPWSMPDFNIDTYPTFDEATQVLADLLAQSWEESDHGKKLHLAVDIETRSGLISVLGLAWSERDALVIPFTSVARVNYWSEEEEFTIVQMLRELLTSEHVEVSGQNYHYDEQYMAKHYAIRPHCSHDTMHMAHVLWTKNLPLSLDFLASMFCEWYRYWKSDGKEFHQSITREEDEQIYFRYNGYDCCYTWEICEALKPVLASDTHCIPYEFQRTMHPHLCRTMLRGNRFDFALQQKMLRTITHQINDYVRWFESLPIQDWFAGRGGEPWYNSAHKLKQLFYEMFDMAEIKDKKTKRPTTNKDALKTLGKREPIIRELCKRLEEYSSLQQFAGLYLKAKPDTDGRMRSMYGMANTDTFRLGSRKDVFGTGMNLQNISKG